MSSMDDLIHSASFGADLETRSLSPPSNGNPYKMRSPGRARAKSFAYNLNQKKSKRQLTVSNLSNSLFSTHDDSKTSSTHDENKTSLIGNLTQPQSNGDHTENRQLQLENKSLRLQKDFHGCQTIVKAVDHKKESIENLLTLVKVVIGGIHIIALISPAGVILDSIILIIGTISLLLHLYITLKTAIIACQTAKNKQEKTQILLKLLLKTLIPMVLGLLIGLDVSKAFSTIKAVETLKIADRVYDELASLAIAIGMCESISACLDIVGKLECGHHHQRLANMTWDDITKKASERSTAVFHQLQVDDLPTSFKQNYQYDYFGIPGREATREEEKVIAHFISAYRAISG